MEQSSFSFNFNYSICSDFFPLHMYAKKALIDCFHDPIMQYVLGGSLHKNNAIYLLLGLYHASVN